MDKKSLKKTCRVCLTSGLSFNKLSKKDEKKITLLAKLKICVQEVEWSASDHICIQCTNLLSIAYTFRETCLNSNLTRKKEEDVKDEENEPECQPSNDKLVERQKEEEGDIKIEEGKVKNDIKDEDSDDDFTEVTNDPSYSSESDQDHGKLKSDLDDEEYKHKKRKKPAKQKKTQQKKDKPKREFKCDKCEKVFPISPRLIEHCVKEHGMESKEVKPWSCERCPLRFGSSARLWQHMKYHDGIKCEMCSYCGKGFITKGDLIIHEKRHLRLGEYKCEPCEKSYHTYRDLSSHQLVVHTDPSKWRFMCQICNKPFPMKSAFDTHMARHAGQKPHACHLCEKKFTTNSALKRHIKSHSHVRDHPCQHCDKEYKHKGVLKVHMAKAHGIGLGKIKIPTQERKFACHFCPKAFYEKRKLTRHIYTHSGEKPFSCPICEKKFIDKSYVKQHLRNTHNVEQQDSLEEELKINYMNSIPGVV